MSSTPRTVMMGFALAMSLIAQVVAQPINSSYTLAGKNFDGSNYTGVVQITPQGSTCRITWQTGGGSQSEGLCMLSGKTLAAFYKLGSEYGLVIYELQQDGSLRGHWSVAGKQGVGTELLLPQK
jgi:hypothetical protein